MAFRKQDAMYAGTEEKKFSEVIGNTEALEKYLQLEKRSVFLENENRIYRFELEKMRKAYSDVASRIDILFNWLDSRENTKTVTIKRKMAELFKFAYMEAQFEDMRAKWKNPVILNTAKPQEEVKTE